MSSSTASPPPTRGGPPLSSTLAGAGLVFVGGFAGSLARYGVAVALPVLGGWPLGTLSVNITGAFLLALLLERLAQAVPETPARRRIRLLAGTGLISGYTTYSTFAVELERLASTGHTGTALAYCATTLAAGLVAALAGVRLAAGRHPPAGPVPVDPDSDQPRTGGTP